MTIGKAVLHPTPSEAIKSLNLDADSSAVIGVTFYEKCKVGYRIKEHYYGKASTSNTIFRVYGVDKWAYHLDLRNAQLGQGDVVVTKWISVA